MSAWEYEDYYTCLSGCAADGCRGHSYKLRIQDTADTYSFWHNGELKSEGPVEELNLLASLVMEAGDAGIL